MLEKQYAQVKAQLKAEQLQAIKDYTAKHPALKEEITAAMKNQPLSRYDFTQSYDDNFSTNSFFRAYLVGRMSRNYSESVATIDTSALGRLKEKIEKLS